MASLTNNNCMQIPKFKGAMSRSFCGSTDAFQHPGMIYATRSQFRTSTTSLYVHVLLFENRVETYGHKRCAKQKWHIDMRPSPFSDCSYLQQSPSIITDSSHITHIRRQFIFYTFCIPFLPDKQSIQLLIERLLWVNLVTMSEELSCPKNFKSRVPLSTLLPYLIK